MHLKSKKYYKLVSYQSKLRWLSMFYNIILGITIAISVIVLISLQITYPADSINFGFIFASVCIASAFIGDKLARG